MHTLEKQCVARQLQSKFQLLHLPCCFVCLRLFFAQTRVYTFSVFVCIAQCTTKKQGVSKVIQSKFQLLHLPCCFVCLRLFLAQMRVLQIVFLFGCHAVVANCAFARYCQIFVAFIT